jgi:hypothetical protein
MLAIDFIIAVAGILYTTAIDSPRLASYTQLLVTYHFGFTRRALVGTIVSGFADVVPFWMLYAIAIAAWIATLILFIAVFRKVFGFNERNLPLLAFVFGSPFFFKNFAISLGHFDIFGCLWALVALLIPAGPLYPLLIASGCVGLILMHNLHFLLYAPTIGFIVLVRYGLVPGLSVGKVIYGLALVVLVSAIFVATAFFGRLPVPQETFLAYLNARASRPLDPQNVWMWYSTISDEIRSTWDHAGITMIRLPVYAVLIALHVPVARYLKSMIVALPTRFLQTVSIAALAGISAGYVAIFVVAYDYSRWVSNWGVCVFLMMHAIRLLPSTGSIHHAPIRPDKTENLVLGWIVTVIPRVGVTIPF